MCRNQAACILCQLEHFSAAIFSAILLYASSHSVCSGLREPCAGLGASAAVRFASWHFASSQVQGSGDKALGAMAMSYCVASLTTAINYIQAVWTAPVSSAPLLGVAPCFEHRFVKKGLSALPCASMLVLCGGALPPSRRALQRHQFRYRSRVFPFGPPKPALPPAAVPSG